MSYSPKQQRAIAWYAEREQLRLCLSIWPVITFQKKSDGSKVEEHNWYTAHRQQQARERAKQRRHEASQRKRAAS